MDTRRVIKSALTAINFSMLAGFAAVVTGAVVLAGWAFDIAAMKSIQPGWVSMKANACIGNFQPSFCHPYSSGSPLQRTGRPDRVAVAG
jgi:hypothetical protein